MKKEEKVEVRLIEELLRLTEVLVAEIDDLNTNVANLTASVTALEAKEATESSAPAPINNDPALLAQIETQATEIAALQVRIDALTATSA